MLRQLRQHNFMDYDFTANDVIIMMLLPMMSYSIGKQQVDELFFRFKEEMIRGAAQENLRSSGTKIVMNDS